MPHHISASLYDDWAKVNNFILSIDGTEL